PAKGPTIANGTRDRWTPQVYYYWSSLGLLGEYVNSTEGVIRDTQKGRVSNYAWQVAGSYVLTGEQASYRGVNPAAPFDPFTRKWGAWEVVVRFSQLKVDPQAFSGGFANAATSANRDNEAAAGFNWYLNRNVKFSLDYAQSQFHGGNGKANRPNEYAIVGQVQLLL
ncbi:MAG: porin, partial [Gammaproteobacteria bacterium]